MLLSGDFAKGLEESFKVSTGAGAYVAALGGLLVIAGGVALVGRDPDEA